MILCHFPPQTTVSPEDLLVLVLVMLILEIKSEIKQDGVRFV